MGSKNQKRDRDSIAGTEVAGNIAKERKGSGGEVLLSVSLHCTESPDAKVRMKRAFQKILRATQGEEISVRTPK